MKLVFLDLATGRVYPCDSDSGIWWWAQGNGSDDCNRSGYCGVDMPEERPAGMAPWVGVCLGAKRLIAVEVRDATFGGAVPLGEYDDKDEPPPTYDLEFLAWLNHAYPLGHELVTAAWHEPKEAR